MVMAPPLACDAAVSLASMATWLSSTGISHTVSSLIFPRFVSPQSTAVLALKLLHNPYAPAPSHCTLQGNCIPVQGTYGCGKDCLIFIPFRLPQISCFTVSLKCFSSDSDNCPNVGIGHLLQFFHSPRVGPVLLLLPPHPSSFIRPSFLWFYIFFSTGQVLLSTLSWCSVCTSVFEGVFLMCLWREL